MGSCSRGRTNRPQEGKLCCISVRGGDVGLALRMCDAVDGGIAGDFALLPVEVIADYNKAQAARSARHFARSEELRACFLVSLSYPKCRLNAKVVLGQIS